MKKRLSRKNAVYTPASRTTHLINYEFAHHMLEVEFINGNVYHYSMVPAVVWKKYKSFVLLGKSSGDFLNKNIKPFFPCRKISDD